MMQEQFEYISTENAGDRREIQASIDAWMELAEPVFAELEAAQRLTARDLQLVINY